MREPKGPTYALWGVSEGQVREEGTKRLIEEIMTDNFSSLMTDMNGATQKTHYDT